MPYFNSVGHIDDNLTPEEVTREYRRLYSLAPYHRKREAITQELGGACHVCGLQENLHFVRQADGPVFKANQLSTMSVARREEVLPFVRLLCEPHSNEVLYNAGKVTHGTWYAAYKKKCRCEECMEYMADYNLRRQEDRRYAKCL